MVLTEVRLKYKLIKYSSDKLSITFAMELPASLHTPNIYYVNENITPLGNIEFRQIL